MPPISQLIVFYGQCGTDMGSPTAPVGRPGEVPAAIKIAFEK
jgi:hypothetical protein